MTRTTLEAALRSISEKDKVFISLDGFPVEIVDAQRDYVEEGDKVSLRLYPDPIGYKNARAAYEKSLATESEPEKSGHLDSETGLVSGPVPGS